MVKRNLFLLSLAFGIQWLYIANVRAQDSKTIIQNMINATKDLKTLQADMLKWERVDGKMIYEKNFVKLQRKPFCMYMKQYAPTKGLEVLYSEGKYSNKAVVNPGTLIPTLKLDPYGSTIRKNQHHTIYATGYDYLAGLVEHLITKYQAKAKEMMIYHGTQMVDGKTCHKIELHNKDYKYYTYTVQAGENLTTIAKKLKCSDFMLKEKNDLDGYDDVKPGKQIQVPTDFGMKTMLYIDQATYLPISVYVYDDIGLYERYDYISIKVNPNFAPEEFTEDYKDYGF